MFVQRHNGTEKSKRIRKIDEKQFSNEEEEKTLKKDMG